MRLVTALYQVSGNDRPKDKEARFLGLTSHVLEYRGPSATVHFGRPQADERDQRPHSLHLLQSGHLWILSFAILSTFRLVVEQGVVLLGKLLESPKDGGFHQPLPNFQTTKTWSRERRGTGER
jgi:hypothetical protein